MTALIIIIAIISVIIMVLFSFFTIEIVYDGSSRVKAGVGLIKFNVYPANKKASMLSSRKYKKLRKATRNRTIAPHTEKTDKIETSDFIFFTKTIIKRLDSYLEYLHTKIVKLNIDVGGEDAAAASLKYGIVAQSVRLLYELLDEQTALSADSCDKISVKCNFLDNFTTIDCRIRMKIRILNLFRIGFETLAAHINFNSDNKE